MQSLNFAMEGERLRDMNKTPTQEDVFLSGLVDVSPPRFRRRKKRGKSF